MFARVITAQAGTEGFGNLIGLAEQQPPAARQRPGFQAFHVLADDESRKVLTISFWETREQMEVRQPVVGRWCSAWGARACLSTPSSDPVATQSQSRSSIQNCYQEG
jgi:hypothetical protein